MGAHYLKYLVGGGTQPLNHRNNRWVGTIDPMLGGGLGQLSKYPPPKFARHFLEYLINVTMYKLESLTKELS